jgi:hypothetical protein
LKRVGRWLAENLTNVVQLVKADIPSASQMHFADAFDPYATSTGARHRRTRRDGRAAAVADAEHDAMGV